MKNLIIAVTMVLLAFIGVAVAGNVHKDGNGVPMPEVFTPGKTIQFLHGKTDMRYTPTAGTKVVKISAVKAIFYKLSSSQNKKDTVGFPIAANTPAIIGISTRSGAGIDVRKIIFTGATSAATAAAGGIYVQEQ
jgi:hypothetical protein